MSRPGLPKRSEVPNCQMGSVSMWSTLRPSVLSLVYTAGPGERVTSESFECASVMYIFSWCMRVLLPKP